MFTGPDNRTLPWSLAALAAAVLWTSPDGAFAQETPEAEEPRRSSTQQIPAGGRDGAKSPVRVDLYDPLRVDGERGRASAGGRHKPGGATEGARAPNNDFWFFTADVILFNDDDNDGFFHGIDLLFDADTVFNEAEVYAVGFLSFEGGPWNEYVVSDTFTIFGATSEDEFVIVTELTSGYRTGHYDLLIELYDAVDGTFLASFGPADTSELALLPLEDFDRDDPTFDNVVVNKGGATGLPAVVALLLLAVSRIARHRVLRA